MEKGWSALSPLDKLVNTSKVEPREYQINIIRSILARKSTLVILPTGLGKTLIGVFAIANALHNGKKALILAPTRPLSEQHYNSLIDQLNLEDDKILLLTGTVNSATREELEKDAKVIAATPQTIANDIKSGRLSIEDFGVIIFDECHRAVGRYAYTYIADQCKEYGVQLVGLTASPGSNKPKIDALIAALGIENIEIRVSTDLDVERYVQGKSINTVYVEKNKEINDITAQLKPVIDEHLGNLYKYGLSYFNKFENIPKGRILEIGTNISKLEAQNYKHMAISNYVFVLDLTHAHDLITTEGFSPFLDYLDSLKNREKKSRVVDQILKNTGVTTAVRIATESLAKGIEHPKMLKIVEILNNEYKGKSVIVFAQFRSTTKKLADMLNQNGITARQFVGKAEGNNQAQQQRVIQEFRENKFRVLVATSIGEEGLDIPSVDAVIFYEPVANEIRNIQRRGRAGRMKFGEVLILVTKDTKDEAYLMIARFKEKRMRELVTKIQGQIARGSYSFTKTSSGQKTLG